MRIFWPALLASCLFPGALASAGDLTSTYTKIKLAECTKGESSDD